MTGVENKLATAIKSANPRQTKENRQKGGSMLCDKCGFGYMVDDSYFDVKVLKCWVCGNRLYVDYPRRWGSLVCSRCGNDMIEENDFGYCRELRQATQITISKL